MNRTASELNAAGALWATLGERGIDIAEQLAELSDEQYRQAVQAIDLFRANRRSPIVVPRSLDVIMR